MTAFIKARDGSEIIIENSTTTAQVLCDNDGTSSVSIKGTVHEPVRKSWFHRLKNLFSYVR